MSNDLRDRSACACEPFAVEGRHVTVIGAGMAGLVAAYELERLGYCVEVLEGEARVGGRIRTHRFGPGPGAPTVELGAMRIPTRHRLTREYIRRMRLGSSLCPFTTLLSDENALLHTDRGFIRIRDASRPLREDFRHALDLHRPGHGYSDATIAFGAWLTAIVDAIAPPDLREALRGDLRRELLDLVDRTDLTPYLYSAAGDRVDLHALFSAHPGIRAGCSGRLNSFLDDILAETSPTLLRLRGGMDQLPRRLVGHLRCTVFRGHRVVGIDVGRDSLRIHIRVGTRRIVRRADFALCTTPFPALRRMRLTGLDDDKLAVIHEVDYCPATKVAFLCREPFWQEDGILGGASFPGGRIRQTYYPPVEGDPEQGAALLASYTIGEEAAWLGRLPPRRRHRLVLEELSAVHPELLRPGMVLEAVSAVWGNSPWSAGCATRWGKTTAQCERERASAARPVNRLFFAGEHCSTAPAWVEGAIESALRAVEEVRCYDVGRKAAAT
ncbi:flavin monoamine oxidase family protein [Streptomyces sp. NPDC001840]